MGEVAILPLAEAVPGHVDGRSEPSVVGVQVGERPARLGLQHLAGDGNAVFVELVVDRLPVEVLGVLEVLEVLGVLDVHVASSASSRRLASMPPRYWPIEPSLRTTRWQGTTTGTGFDAQALPAARTARGEPAARATMA